jgi:hypothetical protein
MIVSARQKPVEQLPEWALCCEAMRQEHSSEEQLSLVVKVDAGSTFSGEAECHHCRRITPNIRCVLSVDRPRLALPVDNYDFDEGESA